MKARKFVEYQENTYVRYYGLGRHNPKRDVAVMDRDHTKLAIPAEAHSFQFYDVFTAVVETGSTSISMKSEEVNFSPVHYYGGELFSLADGERLFKKHESVLPEDAHEFGPDDLFDHIRNGSFPGTTHVIQRRDGDIKPFCINKDVIVEVPLADWTIGRTGLTHEDLYDMPFGMRSAVIADAKRDGRWS